MDTESLTAVLEDAGLSPYQADAYVTLLETGAASASEVAEASDVPSPRIYDVLRGLEELGYVETYEQDSLHARAHDLDEVIEDLQNRIERFQAATDEIERRWEQPSIDDHEASIVKRRQTVLNAAEQYINDAEYHVQVNVDPAEYRALRAALSRAYERGVHVNVALNTHPDGETELSEQEFEGVCVEVRKRTVPAPFVTIVDSKQVAFAPHAESPNEYGILIDDYTHAYVFHWYFVTALWAVWPTIYSERDDELPVRYVDIRQCIQAIEPLLEDGTGVRVRIEGTSLDDGESVEFEGRVAAIDYSDERTSDPGSSLLQLAGKATIVVETDDGERYDVGGQGAMLEDVGADRVTIVDLD